eukprot:6659215-Pyramimonas_sp.AAC.1
MGALQADRVVGPDLTFEEQRCCSEWLTTATRHKPLRNNYIFDLFLRAAPSFDEFDGWAEISELLNKWPPEGCDRYRPKQLETVQRCLRSRHWAYQALTVLT